jgi:RNA polymerase sigma-70 factor (ECF subfamily)
MGDTSRFLRENPGQNTEFLVSKAKAGSQLAWERLYQQYRRMLIAHVRVRIPGFARRRFDAEDVLQIAFTKAWERIASFEYRSVGSFRGWLTQIVVHAFENELRRPRAERTGTGAAPPLDDLSDPDAEPDLDRRLMDMLEAMRGLDEADRDILIQHHVEGMSFEAIAFNLGCPRQAAQKLYTRASERLRRLEA